MLKKNTLNTVIGALIAAAYIALTYISNIFGLAYGPVQFRISEALTVLPLFSPNAIWGLTIGCFISNIASFNPVDMIFGTGATLAAACVTYLLRNVKVFKIPLFSLLSPVIINGFTVGAEISLFLSEGKSTGFLLSSLWVMAGEAAVVLFVGVPLYLIMKKYNFFSGFQGKQ